MRSFKDGYNIIESKGFIEGDIIKEFLNYDDDYKMIILKELNYPWKKNVKEVVNIIETLNNFYMILFNIYNHYLNYLYDFKLIIVFSFYLFQ